MYRYVYEARLSGVEEPFLTIGKLLLDELLRVDSADYYGTSTSRNVTTCEAKELRMNGCRPSVALRSIFRPKNLLPVLVIRETGANDAM